MGCAQSQPYADADKHHLPVKPHLRTTYAAAAAGMPQGVKDTGIKPRDSAQIAPHQVVVVHCVTGAAWAVTIADVLHQTCGLPAWCPAAQARLDAGFSRMSSIMGPSAEIRPVKSEVSKNQAKEPSPAELAAALRECGMGVVVIVSAGATWDSYVLSCLRSSALKDLGLVLLHVPESCPEPGLSDWPPDVQTMLTARGTPSLTMVSCYSEFAGTQLVRLLRTQAKALESTRERQRAEAAAAQAVHAACARAAMTAAGIIPAQASGMHPPGGSSRTSMAAPSEVKLEEMSTVAGSNADSPQPPIKPLPELSQAEAATEELTPWQTWQQSMLSPQAAQDQDAAAEGAGIQAPTSGQTAEVEVRESPATNRKALVFSQAEPDAVRLDDIKPVVASTSTLDLLRSENNKLGNGPLGASVVLAVHIPSLVPEVFQVAQALAYWYSVVVIEGSESLGQLGAGTQSSVHDDAAGTRNDRRPASMFPDDSPPVIMRQARHTIAELGLECDPAALVMMRISRVGPGSNQSSGQRAITGCVTTPTHVVAEPSRLVRVTLEPAKPAKGLGEPIVQPLDHDSLESGSNPQPPLGVGREPGEPVNDTMKLAKPAKRSALDSVSTPYRPAAAVQVHTIQVIPLALPFLDSSHSMHSTLMATNGRPAPVVSSHKVHSPTHFFHSRSVCLGMSPWMLGESMLAQPAPEALSRQDLNRDRLMAISKRQEATQAIAACRHYVLFLGRHAGSIPPHAIAEILAALQVNATVHIVCEVSFTGAVKPDLKSGGLKQYAAKLSVSWLQRLLYYPDHLDPFLAELCSRLGPPDQMPDGLVAARSKDVLPAQATGSS